MYCSTLWYDLVHLLLPSGGSTVRDEHFAGSASDDRTIGAMKELFEKFSP